MTVTIVKNWLTQVWLGIRYTAITALLFVCVAIVWNKTIGHFVHPIVSLCFLICLSIGFLYSINHVAKKDLRAMKEWAERKIQGNETKLKQFDKTEV